MNPPPHAGASHPDDSQLQPLTSPENLHVPTPLKHLRIAACACVLIAAAPLAFAQQSAPGAAVSSPSPDNTRMNQRDCSSETMKPTDQPNDRADIKVAAAVRRAIVRDKSLSMQAHIVGQ